MAAGNRIFGAAIFDRKKLTPYSTATNEGAVSPLLHGEINCIQKFFLTDYPDPATRPDTKRDCVFYATHEPCSLCLSGITWSGFTEFYYLFTYEDTRDAFSIPMDITVLEQVFRVKGEGESDESNNNKELYNRSNNYFKAQPCSALLEQVTDAREKEKLAGEIRRIKGLYDHLAKQFAGNDQGQGLRAD